METSSRARSNLGKRRRSQKILPELFRYLNHNFGTKFLLRGEVVISQYL
jgi:hypothetical protein